ncbi:MAG: HAD-IC family P-type ATPase [Siculibacillus sp.]|nr:HAD-IC family P-type ATPase [Siculibacillus sp.]
MVPADTPLAAPGSGGFTPPPPFSGLDEAEAARRLAHGANELPSPGARDLLAILKSVLSEPMFLMLLVAAGLYLTLGDPHEGLALGVFACLTVGLVILQEVRGERALTALRDLSAPTARVRREGRERIVPAREVVPGDILVVEEGERIAADAVLRENHALVVDESVLTGEGVPVRKIAEVDAPFADVRPGGDDRPELYAATLAVSGRGSAQVARTGASTVVGAIGASLATIDETATTLQGAIAGLVRVFAIFGAAASVALVVLVHLSGGSWVEGILAGLALAMAMLPEEFPMALAIFVALGAERLARVNVLTRRPAIIETLGAATVLATDKTGTLTANRMDLAAIAADGQEIRLDEPEVAPLSPALARVLAVAARASRADGFDPIDRALIVAADARLDGPPHPADHGLEADYAVAPGLLAMTRLWRDPAGPGHVATKGAPEAVARLCGLDEAETAALLARVEDLARRGLRVLAVAEGRWDAAPAPAHQTSFALDLVGLVGFADPLRPTVPAAVLQAHRAGIRVVMITGDHPVTARAIASKVGIGRGVDRPVGIAEGPLAVLTGPEIAAMDDAALAEVARTVDVYARVMPSEKLRLVRALQAAGEVVAMTGDGVNDAPALEAAHCGIAIGPRATDVAKEAADIVLLDEDFGSIVAGVRLGRRIFDNLRKVMIYIAAIHVPIAGLALIPVIFGAPPVMLPLHVVLIEMVIDPICSLAFENESEEPGIMDRPPRDLGEPFVGLRQLLRGLSQGVGILAACLGVHAWALHTGFDEATARTLVFVALTTGNLALVQVDATTGLALTRLFRPGSLASWVITAAAAAALATVIAVPYLRDLFRFALPDPAPLAIAIAAGLAAPLAFDLMKPVQRRRTV